MGYYGSSNMSLSSKYIRKIPDIKNKCFLCPIEEPVFSDCYHCNISKCKNYFDENECNCSVGYTNCNICEGCVIAGKKYSITHINIDKAIKKSRKQTKESCKGFERWV